MRVTLSYKNRSLQEVLGQIARRSLLPAVILFAVSACNIGSPATSGTTYPRGGEVRHEKLVTDIGVNDARKLAKSASSSEGFSMETPETTIGNKSGGALPPPGVLSSESGMFSSKGLKVGELFGDTIRSDGRRFDRLEGSVQDMHNYLTNISPSIDRLVAIESDIQDLVGQLEVLLKDDSASATVPVMGMKAMSVKNVSSVRPASKSTAPVKNNYAPKTIASARGSSASGKTRIVFELSEKMSFSYDLDDNENVLTVFFPDAKNSKLSVSRLKRLKLFNDVTVTPQGDSGYVVALDLARHVSVVNQGKIGANRDNPMYRIYLDLQ